MPQYVSDTTGGIQDRIRLVLGGDEVVIAEAWDVQESVLSQPCAWAIETGWGDVAADLLKRYPPNTPFQLYVADAKQYTGKLDSRGAHQPPGSGTTIRFRGRDALGPLESSDVVAELDIAGATYPRIVWKALQLVGLAPKEQADPPPPNTPGAILQYSNAANRSIKSGVKIAEILPVIVVEEFLAGELSIGGESSGQCRAKVGQSWHAFVRHYLDRAGLFLWADADGNFILSAPNVNQKAAYQIVRRRGRNKSNVVAMSFEDDTSRRHTDYTIYSRGGGKKHGAAKAKGSFVDSEMVDYGFSYPGCIRDSFVQSSAEAAYLARRKLAEERRSGWKLSYVISGNRLQVYGGSETAIVTTDTIVHVDDEELGLDGDFYVESIRRRRGPQTTTEIHLMRKEDIIFGGAD